MADRKFYLVQVEVERGSWRDVYSYLGDAYRYLDDKAEAVRILRAAMKEFCCKHGRIKKNGTRIVYELEVWNGR